VLDGDTGEVRFERANANPARTELEVGSPRRRQQHLL
jgi:hypothetical protein